MVERHYLTWVLVMFCDIDKDEYTIVPVLNSTYSLVRKMRRHANREYDDHRDGADSELDNFS